MQNKLYTYHHVTKNSYSFIVAYPDEHGHDSIEELNAWESGDLSNRELILCNTAEQAYNIAKSLQ